MEKRNIGVEQNLYNHLLKLKLFVETIGLQYGVCKNCQQYYRPDYVCPQCGHDNS